MSVEEAQRTLGMMLREIDTWTFEHKFLIPEEPKVGTLAKQEFPESIQGNLF